MSEKSLDSGNLERTGEMVKAFEEARGLRQEILAELNRIRVKSGWEVYLGCYNDIFGFMGIDRPTLWGCVVYHGFIASTPPWEIELQIDLPGDQSLMAFCRKKLEDLKKM